jgi:2-polyprenyl-6-methoxyphenol hydroxylase-like FAD-dependent oxidoreductase
MARRVGARTLEQHAPSGATLYGYVGGVPWDAMELHVGPDAFAGVFPTHHGQACVWLARPTAAFEHVLGAGVHRAAAWRDDLSALFPGLGARVRAGTLHGVLRGSVGLPNVRRQAAGPGWALVGDAGYHRDPITGHGIADAFRDAELLADATDRVLRGVEPEAVAMTAYADARDAAVGEVFALTRALGAFPAPEEFERGLLRLGGVLDAEAADLAARPVPGHATTDAA